jgi:hypothetical protein
MTGLTVNGFLSATTYLGLPTDVFVTGGTYNAGTAIFTNNTGGTFSVTGFSTGGDFSGGTVNGSTVFTNGLSANTFSATTYLNLPIDIRITGGTYSNGTTVFTNNTGGTFSVTGYNTGGTSSTVFTGGTVTGATNFTNGLSANTFSASTYLGLPTDVFVTGGTYNAGTATFVNNTGGTFNVVGFSTGGGEFSGGTVTGPTIFVNGLSANTFSASTYLGLPLDIHVTGGTYSNGAAIFTNNTGGTFSVTGFSTGYTLTNSEIISVLGYTPLSAYSDTYVTGGTYSNGNAIFTNNTGGTFSVTGFNTTTSFTGGTVNGSTVFTNGLSANTFSASTYLGLPLDIRITGGTYSNGTTVFTNNTGGTFSVTGYFTGNTDVFVTGGTYNAGTATFVNNTGGTFNVTGFSTGGGGEFSGGTVTGPTIFVNGLSANTFSASTYLGLPTDIRVTGGTYSSDTGIATFTNNTGGTFNVTGITFNATASTQTINKNIVAGSASSAATESIIRTIFVPANTFVTGDIVRLNHWNSKSSTGSAYNLFIYASTSPTSFSGALLIGRFLSSNPSFRYVSVVRNWLVRNASNSSLGQSNGALAGYPTDEGVQNVISTSYAIDWTQDLYIHITVLTVGAETCISEGYYLQKI